MSTDVKITFVNKSSNPDKPIIFVFAKNHITPFDVYVHGVAWRTLPDIAKGATASFVYSAKAHVQIMCGESVTSPMVEAEIGSRYKVEQDETGLVLTTAGKASKPNSIEVANNACVDNGIRAQIVKDGSPLLEKNFIAYGHKATFILQPRLYWGIATEIEAGQAIGTGVLTSSEFWEQDIENISKATVKLVGNPKEGYSFHLDNTN
ncbi:MAG: hypothetical protein GY757_42695 [bacterium]|nr:hypothetical protein [bacterium]